MKLIPKNWSSFQHYKDRAPPWIKLHKGLIDDRKYQSLPMASRALAPMLWLLASETKDGELDADVAELAFRLRTSEKEVSQGLAPLIKAGFFIPVHDASAALADCNQHAVPEGEAETEAKKRESAAAIAAATLTASAKQSKKSGMPDGFGISARVQAWADEKGFDRLPEHLEAFTRKVAAKGYTYVDWDASFMEAVREDWAKLRGRAFNGAAPPATVQPIRGRDPALQKLDEDARSTKPPSLEVLARLAAIRQGAH